MLLVKHHVSPAYLINYSNKRATAVSVKRNFEIGSEFYGTGIHRVFRVSS
jgi:hypothetical protein